MLLSLQGLYKLFYQHYILHPFIQRQEELEEQMAENGKGGKSKYGAKKVIKMFSKIGFCQSLIFPALDN